ncbi:hypothetical protein [Streptomyces sp. NBC_00582]|uniref:hypothetical protein n=1 Tax=Streptomyces sp. NBC_00582 TaxID=2975783 RepID=UPI002E80C0D8|nr:hypothetical protein [Streptomyces sp. NBC_00582]WUB64477.1 hypothetical protein OG852_30815 [Streptomyces sp. NBC_00582]
MEQATQATTPTASTQIQPPVPDSFEHAAGVSAGIFSRLEQKPSSVEISADFPNGWCVHFKYRAATAAGILTFAELLDVDLTTAATAFGIHVDAIARYEGIEVRGSALLSQAEGAWLLDLPTPTSAPAETHAVQPVPLNSNTLAQAQAVTPVTLVAAEEISDGDV